MEDQKLAKYLKNSKSKLDPFKDDILYLYSNGATQQSIIQFLKDNDISSTQANLSKWIKRQVEKRTKESIVVIKTDSIRVSSSDELDTLPSHKSKGVKENTKGKDNKVVFSSKDEIKKEDEKSPSINNNDIVPKKKGEQSLEEFIEFNKEIQSSAKEIEERLKKSGVIK